jgi:hypothetical protein
VVLEEYRDLMLAKGEVVKVVILSSLYEGCWVDDSDHLSLQSAGVYTEGVHLRSLLPQILS